MQQMVKIPKARHTEDTEADYPAERVLMSATDNRGLIRSANPAFCDVSQYDISELVGAPHKIVRHPDTPRGLFYLFWDRLKAGRPVCAYVKNRAADGRYYWVFTIVTLAPDGFVSVRVKPATELFSATQAVYADLLKAEANGLSPAKSADLFRAHLRDKGFRHFGTYMSAALDAEFSHRGDTADIAGTTLNCIDSLTDPIDRAETLVRKISDTFSQARGEPINLRILAGRMEGTGDAIGTISKNYESMARDMHHLVERLNGAESGVLIRLRKAVNRGRSAAQVAALMNLTKQQSQSRNLETEADRICHSILSEQSARLDEFSHISLSEINAVGRSIPDTCRQLRRRINGLDLVKLLCRVESGRLGNADNGLNGIIRRLEEAHHTSDGYLAELAALALQIHSRSNAF